MTSLLDTGQLLDTLAERLDQGASAERGGRLASVTVEVNADVDPSALVFASRLAGDRWFCWEQPDRERFALAGVGNAFVAQSRGPRRFEEVASDCGRASRLLSAEDPAELPAGAGPVWVGGFAFSPDGCASPWWSSFPAALMFIPELSILRRGGKAYLTITAAADGLARAAVRLAALQGGATLPMLDPAPTGEYAIRSVRPPGAFESSVEAATEQIRAGRLEKVVLAREVTVEAPAAYEPAAVFGALRELFPSCFCFCVGTPEGAFLGASPELLIQRRGATASTVALAGSTRRSADPAVDDHLGEQLLRSDKDREEHAIVARRIRRSLDLHSVWVAVAPEPELVRVANIQHLATAIRAQLAEPHSALELAGLLHPTPAVGGEPWARAEPVLDELEGMDRGWYAGPIGWMDATEDGEFCVALRSALLRDRTARLFAGGGVVADSDPQAELAETEIKLQALLPLLSG